MINERLRIGVITQPHGLAGDVKIFPTTDEPEKFLSVKDVYIEMKNGRSVALQIERVRFFKQFVIAHFRDYNKIEDIQPFLKKDLWIAREDAVELGEDEYYIADLIGMQVVTDEDVPLGKITDVITTGANDVYVVDTGKGEVLLPAIAQCILKVDIGGYLMVVHLMKGLVEE